MLPLVIVGHFLKNFYRFLIQAFQRCPHWPCPTRWCLLQRRCSTTGRMVSRNGVLQGAQGATWWTEDDFCTPGCMQSMSSQVLRRKNGSETPCGWSVKSCTAITSRSFLWLHVLPNVFLPLPLRCFYLCILFQLISIFLYLHFANHYWRMIDITWLRPQASSPDAAVILIWNTGTNTLLQKLSTHSSTVTQLSFSRHGNHLLSVSKDRTWSLFGLRGVEAEARGVTREWSRFVYGASFVQKTRR